MGICASIAGTRRICRQERKDDIFGGQADSKLTVKTTDSKLTIETTDSKLTVDIIPRKHPFAGISHDPKDAPMFTHKVFTVYWSYLNCDILAIQDDDRTHYPFLKQWVGMEVDIETRWSINNGTIGLDMTLHNAGKHKMEYCVRLKIPEAKLILKTQNNIIGIINEQKRLIYAFEPLQTKELAEFLQFKKETDAYVKHEHLYPKGWSVE